MSPEARVEDIDLVMLRNALQRMSAWDEHRNVDEPLKGAASELGATTYRLVSRAGSIPHPLQAVSALTAIDEALATIGAQHPSMPLHIVAAAPTALFVELGRRLTPATFSSAILHQLVPATAGYVPVLDVVRRAVVTVG